MGTPEAPRATSTWTFAAHFRRGAFGWKSDLPIQRLDEAAGEIRAMVRKDPVRAADGAVRLIEKLSPAFENVDNTSGRLQGVIRGVFDQFVPPDRHPRGGAQDPDGMAGAPVAGHGRQRGALERAAGRPLSSPTDPRTLARAAWGFATKQPAFALEAGLLALGWMTRRYGYEVSSRDVVMAWEACLAAGQVHGFNPEQIRGQAMALCDGSSGAERFVRKEIGLPVVAR